MKTVEGLILKAVNYGESDKILDVASAEGKFTARAKGVRKPAAKLRSAAIPLSFGEFALEEGRSGYVLTGAGIEERFRETWTDPTKCASAFFCVEIFEKCGCDGQCFVDLLKALREINYGETYPPATGLWFGVRMAVYMGIDVTGNVFPEDVGKLFTAVAGLGAGEIGGLDMEREAVDAALRHLSAGFYSEYSVRLKTLNELLKLIESTEEL